MNKTTFKKTFTFGKIDYNGTGRKENLVTVEVELKINPDNTHKDWTTLDIPRVGFYLTSSAVIWNKEHSDCITCGQCLDTIFEYFQELENKDLFLQIYILWKEYHLNDLEAGTEEQTKITNTLKDYDYDKACGLLKKHKKYTDRGYKYGSAWLYRKIKEEDIKKIVKILEIPLPIYPTNTATHKLFKTQYKLNKIYS